jgi:hypothetical protein
MCCKGCMDVGLDVDCLLMLCIIRRTLPSRCIMLAYGCASHTWTACMCQHIVADVTDRQLKMPGGQSLGTYSACFASSSSSSSHIVSVWSACWDIPQGRLSFYRPQALFSCDLHCPKGHGDDADHQQSGEGHCWVEEGDWGA